MRRALWIVAAAALVAVACHRADAGGSAKDDGEEGPGLRPPGGPPAAPGLSRAAGRAARAVQPAAPRRHEGVRGAPEASCTAIPWWSTSGRRGAGPAAPSCRSCRRSRPSAAARSPSSGVNARDKRPAAAGFAERYPVAVSVLRGPGREDRPGAEGARQLPGHRVRRRQGQDRVHPPGRLRGGEATCRPTWTSTSADARDPRRPDHGAQGDRRRRPRRPPRRRPRGPRRPSRSSPTRTRSWRATRTARRRRCSPCGPTAGRPTRPGWLVRVVPEPLPRAGRRCPRRPPPRPTPTSSPPSPRRARTR